MPEELQNLLGQLLMSRSLSLIDLFYEGFMVFIGVAGTITLRAGL
ncbi:MAG: hypothetical protein V3T01_01460 [Myxococcota bacterium]